MTAFIIQLSVSLSCFCTSHFNFQVCYPVYWGAVQHLAVATVTKLVALDEVKVYTGYLYLGIIIVDEYASENGFIPGRLNMRQVGLV